MFSEISLKNITLKKDTLYASIYIKEAKKRSINKTIIKGYQKVSKKHIKRFLNINKKTLINNQKLKDLTKTITRLKFISEIKSPELLFKKDSTLLYLYLKKENNNNFDGIINFSSKEKNTGLLFTGHLKLNLNNILNTGEEFKIAWQANGDERQSFSLYTKLPYIFNSEITPEIKFQIHKQDSTFLNSTTAVNLNYQLRARIHIGASYLKTNSLNINNNLLYEDYKSTFWGVIFSYHHLYKNKLTFNFNPSFGTRNTDSNKQKQFKFTSQVTYTHDINKRNSFFIQNTTGILKTDELLINELFRIGGIESIRGFDEESILSTAFSYLNIEYRYKTTLKSYFFSITDFGLSKNIESKDNLSSLGLGYDIKNKKTSIRASIIINKINSGRFNLNNPKFNLQLTSFF